MESNQLWHDLRAKNIGGSEVAALFGEQKYGSLYELWHVKAGKVEPTDLSGKEYIMAGNFLEPGIMAWANYKWKTNFIQPHTYIKHATVEGMGCTPDGIDAEARIMCQIKKVDKNAFSKIENGWVAEGDNIVEAPLYITLQCQHELECADMDETHLIVCVGGLYLARMIIHRDKEIGAMLRVAVSNFWRTIELDEAPAPEFDKDGVTIKKIRSKLQPIESVDMTGNNQLYDAAARYVKARDAIKEYEEKKEMAAAEVISLIGGAKKISCGKINITMIDNKGSPDKVITPEMVGTVTKGRAPSTYPKITTVEEF